MKLTAYSRRVYIDLHTGKITAIGHQMTEITIWMQNARNNVRQLHSSLNTSFINKFSNRKI